MIFDLPSICFTDKTQESFFFENTPNDLFIDKILSSEVISVLSRKCTYDDAEKRRDFFEKLLANNEFYESFLDLRESLKNCLSSLCYYESNKEKDAAAFLYSVFLGKYFLFLDSVSAFAGSDVFLVNRLIGKANEINESDESCGIKEKIEKIFSVFETENKYTLNYKEGDFYFVKDNELAGFSLFNDIKSFLGESRDTEKPLPFSKVSEYLSSDTAFLSLSADLLKEQNYDFSRLKNLGDEFDFYYEIVSLVNENKNKGIQYSFPEYCDNKVIDFKSLYDITLKTDYIIPNNAYFDSDCPMYLIRGANGGGKTTYLRAVTINLIFHTQGCPVFCLSGCSFRPDKMFTHFPAVESFSENGRFYDEKKRALDILNDSGEDTFSAFNEVYSGTNEKLGREFTVSLVEKCLEKKTFALFVTHHDVSHESVKMLSPVIDEGNRTFKISDENMIFEGKINDILKKYGMDKDALKSREEKN